MKTITDPKLIEEFLTRSVASVYPTSDALRTELLSGKQLTVYVGIDPTSTYVHLGHSTNYLLLERLHTLGHKVIVLVGDFTAMIGDPDKGAARTRLTAEDIASNLVTFKDQIGKILPFDSTENPIEFRFNSDWLKKLTFEEILDLSSNFTVQYMIERDLFEKRIKEQKPLYVHEFMYPLMQGYDSVALAVDLEIGGTDQTFNMLAGRTLVKRYLNKEKMVLATTLLENPATGEAMMSKSKGTGVGLNEEPNTMFAKVMALPDTGIVQVFIDCTRMSLEEIEQKKSRLTSGENPKELKLELAHEIVRMYHSEEVANAAQEAWVSTFSEKGVPTEIPTYPVHSGTTLVEALVKHSLVESKTEARRLIEQGAITNLETGEKVTDPNFIIDSKFVAKVGKHRFSKFES